MSIVEAAIAIHKSSSKKIKMEPEIIDFFRIIEILSPRICKFLKFNFKIGLSKRYTRKLNSQEDRLTPFVYDINSIANYIETEINY